MIVPRPFTGTTVSVAHLEQLRQLVLSLLPCPSQDILPDWSPRGTRWAMRRIRPGVEDLNLALATWQGTGTDASKVTVVAGFVEHHNGAAGTAYYAVAAATLALGEGYNIIYADYTIGASAAAAVLTCTGSPTDWASALGELDSSDTHLKVPLAGWTMAAGVITRGPTWQLGNVKVMPVQAT